jgi:D-xylose transport system substrate-binding protein
LGQDDPVTVGVSWSNFQEERWRTDEAAIVAALEAAGAEYVSADAQSSSSKQLADIESLIGQGVDALIILAQDTSGHRPAVQAAADAGIPVIAYDRLIEDRAPSTSPSTTSRWAGCRPAPCSRPRPRATT